MSLGVVLECDGMLWPCLPRCTPRRPRVASHRTLVAVDDAGTAVSLVATSGRVLMQQELHAGPPLAVHMHGALRTPVCVCVCVCGCVCVWLCVCGCVCVCACRWSWLGCRVLSRATARTQHPPNPQRHTHTLTHPHTHTPTHPHTHTPTHPHTHTPTHSHSHSHTHTPPCAQPTSSWWCRPARQQQCC
jgi:hypothetical protein